MATHSTPRVAYRVSEFAARIGVSTRTVYLWIKNGKLRTVQVDRAVCIPVSELARLGFIRDGENVPA